LGRCWRLIRAEAIESVVDHDVVDRHRLEPKRWCRRQMGMRVLAVLLLVIGSAGCSISSEGGSSGAAPGDSAPSAPTSAVVVPRLKPMYVQQAERALRAAGLRVVIPSVPKVADADAGVNGYAVRSQAPAAGARVPAGTPVVLRLALSVNGGPGGVGKLGVVPNLVGLPINRALSAATAVGLHVTVAPVAHRLSSDAVTKQSLTPGAPVGADEVITLHLD
jgi:PASTA domain